MTRPALEVADIFRGHGAAWSDANRGHVSLDQLKVMNAIESCRTAALGGHDAMRVRVMFELLIPGVEHTEEADLRAEMLRIASDFEEGFGAGLQQEMVQDFLVLQGEWCQFMR